MDIIKLDQSFFNRHVAVVAEELLGKILVYGEHIGIITETEAYRGADDAASHAFRGLTPRSKIMFGPPGYSYVYLIYGMYHCLNITTEPEGSPSAVLIRGLRLISSPNIINLNGPGKVCRHLEINLRQNGIDLTTSPDFFVKDAPPVSKFNITPRIGIKKNVDKLWRFITIE